MPLFGGMSGEQLAAVFNAIRTKPHSPDVRSKTMPWIGALLQEVGGRDKGQAKTIIKLWNENGVTSEETYTNEKRNDVKRVVLNEAKVEEILATYHRAEAPSAED